MSAALDFPIEVAGRCTRSSEYCIHQFGRSRLWRSRLLRIENPDPQYRPDGGAEGLRFTQYSSASNICSPSRAASIDGTLSHPGGSAVCPEHSRYDIRISAVRDDHRADDEGGGYTPCASASGILACCRNTCLPAAASTHSSEFRFSNDTFPLPMMEDEQVVQNSPAQDTLMQQFTRAGDRTGLADASAGSPSSCTWRIRRRTFRCFLQRGFRARQGWARTPT